MKRFQLLLPLLVFAIIASYTQTAQARVYIGLGIGPGFFYGPSPYYYGYPYYYPPPIVYEAAPSVIVRPAPAVQAVPPAPRYVPPAPNPVQAPQADGFLRQLSDPNETVRRDAAMSLGRLQSPQAIDPLINMVTKDASPAARDGAARALGLIGSPRALNALIYVAQADSDRDVRHSAQFAVEIIRVNRK